MNNRIHFPLAKLAATELLEGLVALQHDQKHAIIHRETIEQQFTDLARELGYAVWPVINPQTMEAAIAEIRR